MKKIITRILILAIIILILISDIKIIKNISQKEVEKELRVSYYEDSKEIDIENEYYGILRIPSISLEEGFFHPISKNNKLKLGLKTIKLDEDIIILAAHSGRSNISKFNNLLDLNIGDVIELSLNNEEYLYRFDNLYRVEKTGHIFVRYDKTKKVLVLITCDIKDNNKQIIYISYMI